MIYYFISIVVATKENLRWNLLKLKVTCHILFYTVLFGFNVNSISIKNNKNYVVCVHNKIRNTKISY